MSAALALAAILVAATAAPVQRLLESVPGDSLARPLARLEAAQRGPAAADAAVTLGQLHFARGEYRQAAAAFARAAARSNSGGRAEARYRAGLAWLGAGEPRAARAAFEEAARGTPARRADALLGVALCWERERRPERALETLQTLLAGEPGEAGPAALERTAALAEALRRPELARRSRERLLRDYPRSIEALRARRVPARAGAGGGS